MTQLNGGFSGSRAPFLTIGTVYQHPNEVLADLGTPKACPAC